MPFELIVTSVIGLFSGVISLYTDPQDKKHKIWQLVLLFLIILSAGSTIYFGYKTDQDSRATEARKDSQIQELRDNLSQVNKQNAELLQIVQQMRKELEETGEVTRSIRDVLGLLGWSQANLENPDQGQINQSLQASQLLPTVSGNADQRRAITVQYFPKNVDPAIVQTRLESLGFTLVTGSSRNDLPTDSIWFGSGVDTDSVKAVAYTLIGAGVPLKAIRQFSDDNGRAMVIQVGGDPDCADRPALTSEQIRSIAEFPRQRAVVNCQMVF